MMPLGNVVNFLNRCFRSRAGDRAFLSFHKWLFLTLVGASLVKVIFGVAAGSLISDELAGLRLPALWWAVFVAGSFILWFLVARASFHLDLWTYYYVWVLRVFPLLDRWSSERGTRGRIATSFVGRLAKADRQRLRDVKESLESIPGLRRPRPVFVRREHLMRKRFWRDWTYAIVAILGEKKIRLSDTYVNGVRQQILDVDLRDESYGIFNNWGKEFLREKIATNALNRRMLDQAERFHQALSTGVMETAEMIWESGGVELPLRWASGGFLPIAYYREKYWAALFFRDIYPVGLNLACGASETKDEYKNLSRLIAREFSEELVLLSRRPEPGHPVRQHPFRGPGREQTTNPIWPHLNPAFARRHADLREAHDGISIDILDPKRDGRKMREIDTPFSVNVRYHTPNLREHDETSTSDVLLSINPAELGIEVISACTFPLLEGEYLLDGEFDLGRRILIRHPVVLLDMDFLRDLYEVKGSLGEPLNDERSGEGKRLGPVPPDHYELFGDDLELRERRLSKVEARLEKYHLPRWERANLETEAQRLREWLEAYAGQLQRAQEKDGDLEPPWSDLCPVTWRTLELLFSRNIDYKRFP